MARSGVAPRGPAAIAAHRSVAVTGPRKWWRTTPASVGDHQQGDGIDAVAPVHAPARLVVDDVDGDVVAAEHRGLASTSAQVEHVADEHGDEPGRFRAAKSARSSCAGTNPSSTVSADRSAASGAWAESHHRRHHGDAEGDDSRSTRRALRRSPAPPRRPTALRASSARGRIRSTNSCVVERTISWLPIVSGSVRSR